MRFVYSNLKQRTSRSGRYALVVLVVSLVALGGLLARGSASPQDRFTMADATTTEDNGKRLRPKTGFELVAVDRNTVVARKTGKSTATSEDRVRCMCSPTPPGGYECGSWCLDTFVTVRARTS
jgi:hypothetical protein